MIYLAIWIVSMICAGILANNKNRSMVLWVLLAALFGPLALLPLLCLKTVQAEAPALITEREPKDINDRFAAARQRHLDKTE
jgi:hypothetical protein